MDAPEVAVCIVAPDDALVTLVDAHGVTTERVGPTADDVLAVLARSDGQPEAIFVLGSADGVDSTVPSFDDAAEFSTSASWGRRMVRENAPQKSSRVK